MALFYYLLLNHRPLVITIRIKNCSLTFNLVDTFASRLSQDMVDLHFDFHSTTLNGIPEQSPRWKCALTATSSILGEVLGQQYVERHFTPESKTKMDVLIQNLTKAYGASINRLEWMTLETKKAASEKLAAFPPKIGYPDKWRDYSDLDIKTNDLVGMAFVTLILITLKTPTR